MLRLLRVVVTTLIGAFIMALYMAAGPGLTTFPISKGLWEILPGVLSGAVAGAVLPWPIRIAKRKREVFSWAAIILVSVSLIFWAFYYPLPNVNGLSYKDARTKILNEGWVPNSRQRYLFEDLREKYPDFRFCAASVPFCEFGFRRFGFQCMRLQTDQTGFEIGNFDHAEVLRIDRESCFEE